MQSTVKHKTFWKDETPAKVERHSRKLSRKAESDATKQEAKRRDGFRCRWPHCEYKAVTETLEAAHIHAAGMGGDPKQIRTTRDNLIAMCDMHHRRAPQNMHNGGLKVEPTTRKGTDGSVEFWRWSKDERRYHMVARERSNGILERD